jgi:hypothetical protein
LTVLQGILLPLNVRKISPARAASQKLDDWREVAADKTSDHQLNAFLQESAR